MNEHLQEPSCPTGYRRSPRALPVIVGALVPYRLLQEPLCPTGYCRSSHALPDIVGAYVPYRTLQAPSSPTGYRRSLCALPDIVDAYELYRTQQEPLSSTGHYKCLRALPDVVGAFVPYRLIATALCFIGFVRFYRLIWTSIKDRVLMFEVYIFFQQLCLLTECLTHCLVVFFTDIDRPEPSTTPSRQLTLSNDEHRLL